MVTTAPKNSVNEMTPRDDALRYHDPRAAGLGERVELRQRRRQERAAAPRPTGR